jgi:tetratricopeptide (TPR) repeat protein
MIQTLLLGTRILTVPLVTALVFSAVLGASTSWAQGQSPSEPVPAPNLSEAERVWRIKERDEIRAEIMKLAKAGKLDEAVALSVRELAVTRELRGELNGDMVLSLQLIAKLQDLREDWAEARKALTEVLAIRERPPNQKDWRIADARLAMADVDRRAALTPTQRQRLQEAHRLNQLQDTFYKQGKYTEGIEPCRKVMEIRSELLGEDHPGYAASMHNLAWLYQAMGDYAKAEPLYRHALAICKRALGEEPS